MERSWMTRIKPEKNETKWRVGEDLVACLWDKRRSYIKTVMSDTDCPIIHFSDNAELYFSKNNNCSNLDK